MAAFDGVAQSNAAAGFPAPTTNVSSLPDIGGGAADNGGLPALGGHKPKQTGLALFEEIEISQDDAPAVQEEKEQRQELKQEKAALIAARKEKRQAETVAAERARQAASETED